MAELNYPHPWPLSLCAGRGELDQQRSASLELGRRGSKSTKVPLVRLQPERGTGAGWRRARLFGVSAALMVTLGGCSASPEATRVPGEPGADVGNHGNPVVLVAPPNRFDRIYA